MSAKVSFFFPIRIFSLENKLFPKHSGKTEGQISSNPSEKRGVRELEAWEQSDKESTNVLMTLKSLA